MGPDAFDGGPTARCRPAEGQREAPSLASMLAGLRDEPALIGGLEEVSTMGFG